MFAVIGTRSPSTDQRSWIDSHLFKCNVFPGEEPRARQLSTGAAKGTDQFAANLWLKLNEQNSVMLYLPWPDYERNWWHGLRVTYGKDRVLVGTMSDAYGQTEEYMLAAGHHAHWGHCKDSVRRLHTRNVYIVSGCRKVYACPGNQQHGGGTAMGIKTALHLGITVITKDKIQDRVWDSCGCR